MSDDLVIRLNRPTERDPLLSFIERMGFNPREAATWDGLNMIAMTAWRGDRLVGAIPMEPRLIQLRPGLIVQGVHETVVAVEPAERSRGVGSRMQEILAQARPCDAAFASVFREEPDSPAYRWYVRNGFTAAMRIDSWFCDEPQGAAPLDVYDPALRPPDWHELASFWRRHASARGGGFVARRDRELVHWLQVHPYRGHYTFQMACLRDDGQLIAYALTGSGQMHSETVRLDILDAIASSPGALSDLVRGVLSLARRQDCRPVRWTLARNDPATRVAEQLGFQRRWFFDMLVRPLTAEIAPELTETRLRDWRYAGIDYI